MQWEKIIIKDEEKFRIVYNLEELNIEIDRYYLKQIVLKRR